MPEIKLPSSYRTFDPLEKQKVIVPKREIPLPTRAESDAEYDRKKNRTTWQSAKAFIGSIPQMVGYFEETWGGALEDESILRGLLTGDADARKAVGGMIKVGNRDLYRIGKMIKENLTEDENLPEEEKKANFHRRRTEMVNYMYDAREKYVEALAGGKYSGDIKAGADFLDPTFLLPSTGIFIKPYTQAVRSGIKGGAKVLAPIAEYTGKGAGMLHKGLQVPEKLAGTNTIRLAQFTGATAFAMGDAGGVFLTPVALDVAKISAKFAEKVGRNSSEILKVFAQPSSHERFLFRLSTDPKVNEKTRRLATHAYKLLGTKMYDVAFDALIAGTSTGALQASLQYASGATDEEAGMAFGTGMGLGGTFGALLGQRGSGKDTRAVDTSGNLTARSQQGIKDYIARKDSQLHTDAINDLAKESPTSAVLLSTMDAVAPIDNFRMQILDLNEFAGMLGLDPKDAPSAHFDRDMGLMVLNRNDMRNAVDEATHIFAHEFGHKFMQQHLGEDITTRRQVLETYEDPNGVEYNFLDEKGNPIDGLEPIRVNEEAQNFAKEYADRVRKTDPDQADRIYTDAGLLAEELGADMFGVYFGDNPNVFDLFQPQFRSIMLGGARDALAKFGIVDPRTGAENAILPFSKVPKPLKNLYKNYIKEAQDVQLRRADEVETGRKVFPKQGDTAQASFKKTNGGLTWDLLAGNDFLLKDDQMFDDFKKVMDSVSQDLDKKYVGLGRDASNQNMHPLIQEFLRKHSLRPDVVDAIINMVDDLIASRERVRVGKRSGHQGQWSDYNPYYIHDITFFGYQFSPKAPRKNTNRKTGEKRTSYPAMKVMAYSNEIVESNIQAMAQAGLLKKYNNDPQAFADALSAHSQKAFKKFGAEDPINPQGRGENELFAMAFGSDTLKADVLKDNFNKQFWSKEGNGIKKAIKSYHIGELVGANTTGTKGFAVDYYNMRNNFLPSRSVGMDHAKQRKNNYLPSLTIKEENNFLPSKRDEWLEKGFRSKSFHNFITKKGKPKFAEKQKDGYWKPKIWYHGGRAGIKSPYMKGDGSESLDAYFDSVKPHSQSTPDSIAWTPNTEGGKRPFFLSPSKEFSQEYAVLGTEPLEIVTNVSKVWDFKNGKDVKKLLDRVFSKKNSDTRGLVERMEENPTAKEAFKQQIREGYWGAVEDVEGVIRDLGYEGFLVREDSVTGSGTETNLAVFDPSSVKMIKDEKMFQGTKPTFIDEFGDPDITLNRVKEVSGNFEGDTLYLPSKDSLPNKKIEEPTDKEINNHAYKYLTKDQKQILKDNPDKSVEEALGAEWSEALKSAKFHIKTTKKIKLLEGNKNAVEAKLTIKDYGKNPIQGSVALPARMGIINDKKKGMFSSYKDVTDLIKSIIDKIEYTMQKYPDFAKRTALFYSDMGNTAYQMAQVIKFPDRTLFDVADLQLRFLALGSPRSAVSANMTKSARSMMHPYGSQAGHKINPSDQQIAGNRTAKEWDRGEHFEVLDPNAIGADDKVRNFYLNGLAELIEIAKVEGTPKDVDILLDRASKTLGLSKKGQTLNSKQKAQLQVLLDGLATIDMWDMAGKNYAHPAYIPKSKRNKQQMKSPFHWSVEKHRVVHKAKGDYWNEALKQMNYQHPQEIKYQQANALQIDGRKNWNEDTWAERLKKPIDEKTEWSYYAKADEDGLTPKGGGALYDAHQSVDGLIADELNDRGYASFFGKNKIYARNAQEILWALTKLDNPLPANQNLVLFGDRFTPLYESTQKLAELGKQIQLVKDLPNSQQMVDMLIDQADKTFGSELPTSASDIMRAVTDSYNKTSTHILPFEVTTYGASSEALAVQAQEKAMGQQAMTEAFAQGLAEQLQQIADGHGLRMRVDELKVGQGGYTENGVTQVAPNITMSLKGDPSVVNQVMVEISRGLDQADGNVFRKPTIKEVNMGGLNEAVTFDTRALDATQKKDFFTDLNKLVDGDGDSFLTGFTESTEGMFIADLYYKPERLTNEIHKNKTAIKQIMRNHNVPTYKTEQLVADNYTRENTASGRPDRSPLRTAFGRDIFNLTKAKVSNLQNRKFDGLPQVPDPVQRIINQAEKVSNQHFNTSKLRDDAMGEIKELVDIASLEGFLDKDGAVAMKDDISQIFKSNEKKNYFTRGTIEKKAFKQLSGRVKEKGKSKVTNTQKKNILWAYRPQDKGNETRNTYFSTKQFETLGKNLMGKKKSMDLIGGSVRKSASTNYLFDTASKSGKIKK